MRFPSLFAVEFPDDSQPHLTANLMAIAVQLRRETTLSVKQTAAGR